MKKSILSAFFLAGSLIAADKPPQIIPESDAAKYPSSLKEVPSELIYPQNASFKVDADGNYVVDGKIRFLLGAQPCKVYDSIDLVPKKGVYPEALNWLYDMNVNFERAQRIGFDAWAPFTTNHFVDKIEPGHPKGKITPSAWKYLKDLLDSKLPIEVDFTCVEYEKGCFNSKDPKLRKHICDDALNADHRKGINHWLAYNIFHPEGRRLYKAYWEAGVEEYKNGGPVIAYELFNEPGYDDQGPYNRKLFAEYLEKKYGNIRKLNQVWKSSYASFKAASEYKNKCENFGLAVDWGKFMEEGFADICKFGSEVIRSKVPGARICVQSLGAGLYRRMTRCNINPYLYNRYTDTISVPTGGGLSIASVAAEPAHTIDNPASAPDVGDGMLCRRFYLALADGKPIINGEMYVHGGIRRAIWMDLLRGSNASFVFEWSKRAWAYYDHKKGYEIAEQFPYHILNPYNKVPLYEILQAKKEVFKAKEFFFPRRRNVKTDAAILLSYPTERASEVSGNVEKEEACSMMAALTFSHVPADVILEEQLPSGRQDRYKVLIAVGVDQIYPATKDHLLKFVEKGGVLILARGFMEKDEYNHDLDWKGLLPRVRENESAPVAEIRSSLPAFPLLPGKIRGRNTRIIDDPAGYKVLASSEGKGVLFEKSVGKGKIFLVTPEMQDMNIAALLLPVLEKYGVKPVAKITRPDGELAPNIELFASHQGKRSAYFLLNHDAYPKLVTLSVPELQKSGGAADLLSGRKLAVKSGSVSVSIPGKEYRVIGVNTPDLIRNTVPADEKAAFGKAKKKYEELVSENEKKRFTFKPDLSRTRCIDIRNHCNCGYDDGIPGDGKGGWTDQGRENSMTGVPWGRHTLLGVPCDLIRFDMNNNRTCIVMKSKNRKGNMPEKVENIRIGGKISKLYFFHTAAWVGGYGETALIYRLHYRSGKVFDVKALTGRDIGNWWIGSEKNVAFRNRLNRGFYCMEWVNPDPQDDILSLDIVSLNSGLIPIVIGITAEEAGNEKVFPFGELRGYAINGLKAKYEGNRCTVFVTPQTTDWANFTCGVADRKKIFSFTPEEWKRAKIRFYVNGGADRFGNPKGGQELKVFLRTHINGREIYQVGGTELRKFVEGKKIDSDPATFQKVEIPFTAFPGTKPLNSTVTSVGFQFLGCGKNSGVILRDFSIIVPEK